MDREFWICETGWLSQPRIDNNTGQPIDDPVFVNPITYKSFYTSFLNFDNKKEQSYDVGGVTITFMPPEQIMYFCLRDALLTQTGVNQEEFFWLLYQ